MVYIMFVTGTWSERFTVSTVPGVHTYRSSPCDSTTLQMAHVCNKTAIGTFHSRGRQYAHNEVEMCLIYPLLPCPVSDNAQ